MKHFARQWIWLFLLSATASAAAPAKGTKVTVPRARYNFNQGWCVEVGDPAEAQLPHFDDSHWKRVTLPYAWNEDSAFKVSIHDLPTGIAWYRKHFSLPENSQGLRIVLEFEGIRMAGDVYLNGKLLGRHEDGVSAFGFDITDSSLPFPAENVIAIRTDNKWKYKETATGSTFQWNDANFYANYGGISKNVWLHVTAPLHQTLPLFSSLGTTGTYIWASNFDFARRAALITAESQVHNDSSKTETAVYAVRIDDMAHRRVASFNGPAFTLAPNETHTFSAASMVQVLHFWSWGYGYLYDVTTTISVAGHVIDSVRTRTGFRATSFEHGEVKLNNRVIQLHGYGQRTTNEWPALGIDVPPWVSDFSNRLMVESNGNLVRWMHVTPSKQDVESTDRAGLMVSMPAGDSEGDSSGRQWAQRVQLMRDSIIYNRNNPSIIFYESGNHGVSEQHMAEMKAIRDEYDSHGGRAIGAREMLASKVAEYGGEMLYIDKSSTKPLWAHEYNRDEGARAFWDDDSPPFHKDSPLYNRDQDSAALQDVVTWDDYYRARPGTGNRVSAGGVNIIFSDSNTHYRGDNNYRRSGEVDAMRLSKDGFFAHQVIWNGWVDPEKPAIHILGHWNYQPGTIKPVYVIAAGASRIELKLNGKVLGSINASPLNTNQSLAQPAGSAAGVVVHTQPNIPAGQSNDFLFTFPDISFASGTLEAVAYDASGKLVAASQLHTAAAASSIRLTPHTAPAGLHADGSDLALVDVEIVDAKGHECPVVSPMVTFHLTGPAEWRGGIAQGSSSQVLKNTKTNDNHGLSTTPPTPLLYEDNYILATTLPAENGINRVSIRALPLAGSKHGVIRLTAESPGLSPATVTLNSIPVPDDHGLSTYDPIADLPSFVLRGPTPPGSSVRPSRISLAITGAVAGSNSDRAALSFDDNESTSWSNDGQLSTAWIEYTLAKRSAPTQIELKLNAFRTRRYPLRITLDGTTVYEGTTPNSLGYVAIPLQKREGEVVSGTHLRIALTASPIDGTQATGTAEITGKYDGAGVSPVVTDGKATLNIIEVDIYEDSFLNHIQ